MLRVLFAVLLVSSTAWSAEPLTSREEGDLRWYDIRQLGVEGQGWADVKSPYDRFPAKAEATLREPVWSLSRHSAGMCVGFVTTATAIHARWTLTSDKLAMPHMPATGVSGLDLYARDAQDRWRWVANKAPTEKTSAIALATGLAAGTREYLLYLPLYNGVTEVEIGVPKADDISHANPYSADHAQPLVFYGTSITHGACASRPGMVHTAMLGRRYQRPVINLGFSGNGRMEPEVGALLTELDAAIYIIDCCPNLGPEDTAVRTKPLVEQLRKARPTTPILLVEDRDYTDRWIALGKGIRNDGNHRELRKAYEELVAAGVTGLHYLPGGDLLGDDTEGAVDSSHPNDLGFFRQAEAFAKVLDPLFLK